MDPKLKHQLIWGWLRLLLGLIQVTMTTASATLLWVAREITPPVLFTLALAVTATVISRWLYRGRKDPASQRPPSKR